MTECFSVTVNVLVEATHEDEAALIIERLLAGRFDSELVAVVEVDGGGR